MCSANKEERMTVFETYISIEFEICNREIFRDLFAPHVWTPMFLEPFTIHTSKNRMLTNSLPLKGMIRQLGRQFTGI